MTLNEFVQVPERMTMYRKWRDSAMTQEMFGMAMDIFGPSGLPEVSKTGEKALYYAGSIDAHQRLLTFMLKLEDYYDQQVALAKMAGLTPEYGMQQVLDAQEKGEGD